MEENSAAATQQFSRHFFLLHVVLIFSIIFGALLNAGIVIVFTFLYVPIVQFLVQYSSSLLSSSILTLVLLFGGFNVTDLASGLPIFQTPLWGTPLFLTVLGFPLWIAGALITGTAGLVIARGARGKGNVESEGIWIRWTIISGLYNLIVAGLLLFGPAVVSTLFALSRASSGLSQ
jgi:hypothetical protein